MPDPDLITAYVTGAQLVFVAGSVYYLARQVRGEKRATAFQAYSQVTDAYVRHLWLATDRPLLNEVWDDWEPDGRGAELHAAQDAAKATGRTWGAWSVMTDDERISYRYTRGALEIFEQAWELHRRDLVPDETWERKWQEWLKIWKRTRYYAFVFEDTRARMLPDFCRMVTSL